MAYAPAKLVSGKSIAMALVKKSTLKSRSPMAGGPDRTDPVATSPRRPAAAQTARTALAADRIQQASEELASGLGEAAAAAAELQRTMDQISSGAEEAAGAAQESLGLIAALGANFRDARSRADEFRHQCDAVETSFGDIAGQIESSIAAIELGAQRQLGALPSMEALETAAQTVDAIGARIGDLSEQTNLLALNAVIEASRGGDGALGFSVVADEVRALAESSETDAAAIRDLAARIGEEIRMVALQVRGASELATSEARQGSAVIERLREERRSLAVLAAGAQDILNAAAEAEVGARESERGAEQVASAAEEQSAAAAQAQQAIEQQSASLDQSQQTAEALADLIAAMEAGEGAAAQSEQIAAAAEELSATVQELSGASSQIQVALEQIGRGTEIQVAATHQANAAMTQIEQASHIAQNRAEEASTQLGAIVAAALNGQSQVGALAGGVEDSLAKVGSVQALLAGLSDTNRQIERIADTMVLTFVQTRMLAVHGAVEATRAGDAGRGFAAVTQDIRKLAQQASASCGETRDTVRQIQDTVASVQRDLDQVAGSAESEIVRNRSLIDRFGTVIEELQQAAAANTAIADSAQQMLDAVREVRVGTSQIAEAADAGMLATREAGATAQQQAHGAEALAAAIEEIASIAAVMAAQT